MTRIAFQGITGAYSEEAIRQFFGPEQEGVPYKTLNEVFLAVEKGQADYAMVPVENAVAGSVDRSYKLLMEYDLRVYAEVILRVRHSLLAPPDVALDELQRVCSHPQALAQCQRYLNRHDLEPEPGFDTAGSARDLAADPEPGLAAIAGSLAAELYGLDIIAEDIEDFPFNYTRFFLLSLDDPPRAQQTKTSLVFSTRHRPGALHTCLGEFAARGLNLTKIESRPRLNRPWQYIFYLDFEGHWQDPKCEAAIMGLLRASSFVKLLGSYPAATTPAWDNYGS